MLTSSSVNAFMVSFNILQKDKAFRKLLREGAPWAAETFLDSGIFTFLRRAGVAQQSVIKSGNRAPVTWEEFSAFAKLFITYVSENADIWDHIVELDVEELFGVEIADALRARLYSILGDKLLPVWHAQRGAAGWTEMVNTYKYICLSPTRAFPRSARTEKIVAQMLLEAKNAGCKVHILGVEQVRWFELGATSIDCSSWSVAARFGNFKMPAARGGAPTSLNISATKKFSPGRRVQHARIAQFVDLIKQFGYSLEDLSDYRKATMVAIKLLQLREEDARARFTVPSLG